MRYETLLKINCWLLALAVIAIVALLVLFYLTASDNARQQAFIEMQNAEICGLYADIEKMANDDLDMDIKEIASELLNNTKSIDEAVKNANEYYESVKELLTTELWRQHRERCARGQECTKK